MLNINSISSCIIILLLSSVQATAQTPVENVDTSIGGISHICVPTFQMVQRPNGILRFRVDRFNGLRECYVNSFPLSMPDHRNHLVFAILPWVEKERSAFGKHIYDCEKTTVADYSVYLDSANAEIKMACANKGAVFDFNFECEETVEKGIVLESRNGTINASSNRVEGFDIIKISRNRKPCPERDTKVWLYGEFENASFNSDFSNAKRVSAILKKGEMSASFKYAVSYISLEQAKRNFFAEIKGRSREDLASESLKIWNEKLSCIEVKGGIPDRIKLFYTSLWRCYERMTNASEDGWYKGFDGKIHQERAFDFRNDDWTWDTYRTLHPLMCILEPAAEVECLRSYIRMYEESGYMPTFPSFCGDKRGMINNHYASIFWDAYAKGLRGFDLKKAYEGCKKTILERSIIPWYDGAPTSLDKFYTEHGYFPALGENETETVGEVDTNWELRQSVSVTLGQSFDDWCVANMARAVGDKSGAELFEKRSLNYRNLFDSKIKFFAPKDKDGKFINFDTKCLKRGARPYYAENNAWTYRWDVPHNIGDLISLYGGNKEFEKSLDDLFVENLGTSLFRFYAVMPDSTGMTGQFSAGNEPSFGIPYMYVYAGAPWKTQKMLNFILDRWFRVDYMGLPGDEDGGALSAYYVFTSMGFYPVSAGIPIYVIGAPQFDEVNIKLPNGRNFKILARGVSEGKKYIKSAKLNGKNLDRAWFTHEDLISGGALEFEMSLRPNKEWASNADSLLQYFKTK